MDGLQDRKNQKTFITDIVCLFHKILREEKIQKRRVSKKKNSQMTKKRGVPRSVHRAARIHIFCRPIVFEAFEYFKDFGGAQ